MKMDCATELFKVVCNILLIDYSALYVILDIYLEHKVYVNNKQILVALFWIKLIQLNVSDAETNMRSP